jgi:hypothetical protein
MDRESSFLATCGAGRFGLRGADRYLSDIGTGSKIKHFY